MKILLIALGTRGDVQPALALGKGLQAAGHPVRMFVADNFAGWVRGHGLAVAIAGADVQAMMQSEDGVAWAQARSPMDELRQMRVLFEQAGLTFARNALAAAADVDVIIGGFTSDNFAASIAEHLGKRYLTHALQPLFPTRSGAATAQPFKSPGDSVFNLWSTKFAEFLLYDVFQKVAKAFRQELGLAPLTRRDYYNRLHQVPALCGFSEHIVPHPKDWPAQRAITGYWFLDNDPGWQPPLDLLDFLNAGTPPIYIGFGSMSDANGRDTAAMILRALRQNKVRAVLAQGWSGLGAEDVEPRDDLFVLHSVPHSWLFPHMAAVVHHGGAGTTGAAFRAGVPQFIIPHFGDQPYWGRRVYELGVGVRPLSRRKLSEAGLSEGIRELIQQTEMTRVAQALGERVAAEAGVSGAVNVFEQWNNTYGN